MTLFELLPEVELEAGTAMSTALPYWQKYPMTIMEYDYSYSVSLHGNVCKFSVTVAVSYQRDGVALSRDVIMKASQKEAAAIRFNGDGSLTDETIEKIFRVTQEHFDVAEKMFPNSKYVCVRLETAE